MQLTTQMYDAFRLYARSYLEPVIIHNWTEWQTKKLQMLSKANVVFLGGDRTHKVHLFSFWLNVYALYQQFQVRCCITVNNSTLMFIDKQIKNRCILGHSAKYGSNDGCTHQRNRRHIAGVGI